MKYSIVRNALMNPWLLSPREQLAREKTTQLEGHPGDLNSVHLPPAGQCGKSPGMWFSVQFSMTSSDGYFSISFGVLSICLLSLSSSSSIRAVKHILFGEIYLFRLSSEMRWLPVFLSNDQIFTTHSGRLILVSFNYGQTTSSFEIPLSLSPGSRTNL